MKVYVCPVCDHAMHGRHYCRNCHQFVKNPYFIEKKYSLDRASAEPNVCDCDIHTGVQGQTDAQKRKEQQALDRDYQEAYRSSYEDLEKKKKQQKSKNTVQSSRYKKQKPSGGRQRRKGRTVWMILAVYVGFQVLMAFFDSSEGKFDELKQEIRKIFVQEPQPETTEGIETEVDSDWTCEELDYDQILEEGQESTGLGHFDMDGSRFLEKLHAVLMDADFEAVEEGENIDNFVAVNSETGERYTYYQKIYTVYLSEDFMEYYCVTEDSVSGRLVSAAIQSRDYDQACFFTEAAASILLSEDKQKQDRLVQLLECEKKLLDGEPYHAEDIGNMTFSGYVYDMEKKAYFFSLTGMDGNDNL